jgi:nitrogen fixation/metabolism regulation signal transduction histidine kinase
MVYKKFTVQIVVRVALLLIVLLGLAYFSVIRPDYIKVAFISLLAGILIFEMYRYVGKSNRDFRSFLNMLQHDDFTSRYQVDGKGRTFDALYEEMNRLGEKYRQINLEKEIKHQHLQSLLSHVDIGVISLDGSNQIQLVNQAFRDVLNAPFLAENQSVDKLDATVSEAIRTLKPGQKKLLKTRIDEQDLHLSLQANLYKLREEEFKLISVKNIRSELEQQELESYEKLIRVLTHEIMNSITPIASLSNTLNGLLLDEDQKNNPELPDQIKTGIAAIHDRSSNLLAFTQNYRKLTRLPQPEIQAIDLNEMIQQTVSLVKSYPGAEKVAFETRIEPGLVLNADPKLIEQVLLNVYKNAVEVLDGSGDAIIRTNADRMPNERVRITLEDNGPGIRKEILEKIFIPFYTTKKEGSGIGLSLCRQIILAHHGIIKAESSLGVGTKIEIVL